MYFDSLRLDHWRKIAEFLRRTGHESQLSALEASDDPVTRSTIRLDLMMRTALIDDQGCLNEDGLAILGIVGPIH